MTHVYLETGRLTLRRFTPDDVDNLVELDSDPDVIRYVTRHQPSREEVVARLSKRIAYYDEEPGFGVWAAVERVTGDFIGWFHEGRVPAAVLAQGAAGAACDPAVISSRILSTLRTSVPKHRSRDVHVRVVRLGRRLLQ